MRLNVVLVDHLHENIHDLTFNGNAEGHEFAVDAMEDRLQVVPFARIFTVEQIKEAVDKVLRDVTCDHIVAKVGSQDELEKQLIDELQVWPSLFQMGFVFIRVHRGCLLVVW